MLLPLWVAAQSLSVHSMRTNGLESPLGVNPDERPVLNRILKSDRPETIQEAYRIAITEAGKKVWDSGRVESDNSVAVSYEGALQPDTIQC